jgi:nucleoside-diphosphate-sugar epimerase
MTILLTGAAGFIGAYTARALLEAGQAVVGLDNFNDYYDPQIKRDRVAALCPALDLRTLDLTDRDGLAALFDEVQPTAVIHLAAQAGVRYSLENPHAYVDSNLVGFVNMLELCRHRGVQHLVYASSSSVYGDSATPPFSEDQRVDQPRSLYAATKAANELMAYTYAQLYGRASDRRVQRRPHAARFHTCFRHRIGYSRRARASGRRSGTAPGVQPRQPYAGRAGALHQRDRAGRRPPRAEGLQAHAAR